MKNNNDQGPIYCHSETLPQGTSPSIFEIISITQPGEKTREIKNLIIGIINILSLCCHLFSENIHNNNTI